MTSGASPEAVVAAEPVQRDRPPPVSLRRWLSRWIWICIGPLLAVAAVLAVSYVLQVQRDRDRQAGNLASDLARSVDQVLQARLGGLQMLALSPMVEQPAQHSALYQEAQGFVQAYGSHVILADRSMQMLFYTLAPLGTALATLPRSTGRSAAPLALASGKPAVGDLVQGPLAGQPLVALVVPALRDAQVKALLLTVLEARQFQPQLDALALPAGWALLLLDGTGQPIAGRGMAELAHSAGGSPPWAGGGLAASAGPSSVFTSGAGPVALNGPPASADIRAVAPLAQSAWMVAVVIPPGVRNTPLLAAGLALAVAMLGATLAGVLGGRQASRRLERALIGLTQPQAAGAAPSDIAEVAAVSRLLVEAASRNAATDVTLRDSEQRFRRLFQESPVAMALLDSSGTKLELNLRFVQDFGYDQTDLKSVSDWWPRAYPDPDYRALVMASWTDAVRRAAETGSSIEPAEYLVCCKDGSRRHCIFSGISLERGLMATVFDITERKQAEVALHASQAAALEDQRQARLVALKLMEDAVAARARTEAANAALGELSQLVEQSPASVLITDLQTRIEYVNAAFLHNSGFRREEVIGQPMRMLKSGKTPDATYANLWQALQAGQAWSGEFVNRRKDGNDRVEQARVWPLRQADGSFTRYATVQEDVTENRRMVEELSGHRHHLEALVASRTAELEAARSVADAANRAKSAFLANMSHEIRTPLNAVIGLTHLLQCDQPTPAQHQRLGKIDTAAQHLLSLISDILDLSKIEAGHLQLEQTDFDLAGLLAGVCALHAEPAQRKGLDLAIDPGTPPHWLRGDPTRLRQALINYLGNAIKFTERGSVRLGLRSLAEDAHGVLLRFEVRDTGVGLSLDQLAPLFGAFTQADASTTRKYGGTGLGLAITRRIAALMGGESGATSSPGLGSCFWFTARFGFGEARQPALPDLAIKPESALRQGFAGARLLLVEDNPVNREVAQALLEAVSLQVEVAETGQAALDKLSADHYDLVLMDMQLPDMDGTVVTRILRNDPGHAHLPVVAMTANAFADDRSACLAAGMNDFVAKPVNPHDLYATLLRWLSKGRAAAQDRQPAAGLALQPDAAAVGGSPVIAPAAAPIRLPVTPPAMNDALSALLESLGPQARRTLKMLRGDALKYQRLLISFAQAQGQDMARVQALLAQGEGQRGPASALAHDLKGAAGSLGAAQVAALADALEIALRRGVDLAGCAELARQGDAELQRLVQAIQHLPDLPPAVH